VIGFAVTPDETTCYLLLATEIQVVDIIQKSVPVVVNKVTWNNL
jgi:hypothetical protein